METNLRRGPGRPRKVVFDVQDAGKAEAAHSDVHRPGEDVGSHPSAGHHAPEGKEATWLDFEQKIHAEQYKTVEKMIVGVCVPCMGFPTVYKTRHSKFRISRGDKFEITFNDGSVITP